MKFLPVTRSACAIAFEFATRGILFSLLPQSYMPTRGTGRTHVRLCQKLLVIYNVRLTKTIRRPQTYKTVYSKRITVNYLFW